MDVSTQLSPGGSLVTLVRLPAEKLDPALVRKELGQILAEKPKHLLLDLSQVTLINSRGVSALVWARRLCSAAGCHLKLCGLGEQAKLVLKVTRLDSLFEIYPSVEAALKEVSES
ncbi:STAS domain-containing protein [Synechococcus sp. H65.1]|uniref:STAS domain-containing protein n=1 Tax=unclassified Synechococcus TaxID=2626047 RepID=UPI0039C13B72